MKLDQAISEQISRITEEEPQIYESSEVSHLLKAMISLINAYLNKIGEYHEPPVRTFGSNG